MTPFVDERERERESSILNLEVSNFCMQSGQHTIIFLIILTFDEFLTKCAFRVNLLRQMYLLLFYI